MGWRDQWGSAGEAAETSPFKAILKGDVPTCSPPQATQNDKVVAPVAPECLLTALYKATGLVYQYKAQLVDSTSDAAVMIALTPAEQFKDNAPEDPAKPQKLIPLYKAMRQVGVAILFIVTDCMVRIPEPSMLQLYSCPQKVLPEKHSRIDRGRIHAEVSKERDMEPPIELQSFRSSISSVVPLPFDLMSTEPDADELTAAINDSAAGAYSAQNGAVTRALDTAATSRATDNAQHGDRHPRARMFLPGQQTSKAAQGSLRNKTHPSEPRVY